MKLMFGVNPSWLFRFFNKNYLVCSFPSEEKVLYLTFDDGPDPDVTPGILRILKERNARATFFCTGENAKNHAELFHTIIEEGHEIGNHTFSHLDGWKTPPGEYVENISRCEAFFKTAIFRPPYGRFSVSQYYLLRKKYTFILWSLMSGDFHRKISPDQCLSNVLKNAEPGSIIVFHNNLAAKEKVLYALPLLLDHYLQLGFIFKSVQLHNVPSSAKL